MKLALRQCNWDSDDFERLRSLHEATMRPALEDTIGWDSEAQRDRLLKKYENQTGLYFVTDEASGHVVGSAKIFLQSDNKYYVEQFYIHPNYKNTKAVFMLVRKMKQVVGDVRIKFYALSSDHSIDYTKKKHCVKVLSKDGLDFYEYIP